MEAIESGAIIISMLILWCSCAGFASTVAGQKGYEKPAWIMRGLFFGIVALIAAAGLPDRKK